MKTYHNLWDTANAMLKVKFIAVSAYIKKTGASQINYLMIYLKLLKNMNNQTQTQKRKK
jgi:hypothetical protein